MAQNFLKLYSKYNSLPNLSTYANLINAIKWFDTPGDKLTAIFWQDTKELEPNSKIVG